LDRNKNFDYRNPPDKFIISKNMNSEINLALKHCEVYCYAEFTESGELVGVFIDTLVEVK